MRELQNSESFEENVSSGCIYPIQNANLGVRGRGNGVWKRGWEGGVFAPNNIRTQKKKLIGDPPLT